MPLVADVAIPVPLSHPFTYAVPDALRARVQAGGRVLCVFGRRKVLAVVLDVAEREADPAIALKPIEAVVDDEPALPAELLSFLRELGRYYLAPIGEVLRMALPAVERDKLRGAMAQTTFADAAVPSQRQVGGRKILHVYPTSALEAAGSLRGQAALVLASLRASGEIKVADLERQFGNARAAVKKLAALGLVDLAERAPERGALFAESQARDTPPELTLAQAQAVSEIERALGGEAEQRAFLLFGVTGSGKTEVYLRAIAKAVALGRGALMMVPEIALTPQLVSRFRARFGDDVAVLHSGLTATDRHAMWTRLRSGEVKVAIGARSALFAPVPDLGLCIVDEEHDSSFKQEEGVRYHARDMALLRAHRAGAVTIMGSATPSLESIALVRRGKMTELRLPDRAHSVATLPKVSVVDIRRIGAGPSGDPLVSIYLHRAIEETLAAKQQTILFLNRRGFSPSVVCDACGSIATCHACSVALTYHRRGPRRDHEALSPSGRLRCHYCEFESAPLSHCQACGAPDLLLEGLGTEQLEATIAEAFPSARVARLDRDVASGSKAQVIMDRMRRGEIDILVGTQMVTKGHDLPNVTLVGVVNADAALSMPDFRASERGFAVLVQVAGRAGRHDKPGRVLIQTRNPEHPAIVYAQRHDVSGFLEHELADRREVGYPPFARLALVRIDAVSEDVARGVAERVAAAARTSPLGRSRDVEVLGPAAAPIARLRGRFRFRVLLRSVDRRPLRQVLSVASLAAANLDSRARVIFDVDPVSML